MDGREFARFRMDVGIGDEVLWITIQDQIRVVLTGDWTQRFLCVIKKMRTYNKQDP